MQNHSDWLPIIINRLLILTLFKDWYIRVEWKKGNKSQVSKLGDKKKKRKKIAKMQYMLCV